MTKFQKIIISTIVLLFIILGGYLLSINNTDNNKNNIKESNKITYPKVKIGYQKIALYRHIFTAKEKGYFKEEGLDVELVPFVSGNKMMQAFLNNDIDVLGLTNFPVALTVEGKDPGKFKLINFLVWKEKSYPDYIISRKDSNIKNLKDLEGKTLGLHPGSAVKAFSKVVLEKFGVDMNKVKTISLKPPVMQSSLLSGRVDAIYGMDPVATTLMNTGKVDVLVENPMKYIFPAPTPIAGTAVSPNLDKKIIDKLTRAINKAISYMRNNGDEKEIAQYISKYTPISPEMALKMNISEYWKLDEVDLDRVQKIADKFYELEIIKSKINTKKLIYEK